jgi:hypothetical protein
VAISALMASAVQSPDRQQGAVVLAVIVLILTLVTGRPDFTGRLIA